MDAELAAHRVLEFDANHTWGCLALAMALALQEKWGEARHFAEKATPLIPIGLGILAGILKHMGEANRSEVLIQKLITEEPYGAPSGLCYFYFLSRKVDEYCDCIEKLIEQRHLNAVHFAIWYGRSSPRWPALARLINLPEEAR